MNKIKLKKALPSILTGIACLGVFATGIFSARASVKCLEELEVKHKNNTLDKKEAAKTVIKHSILPVAAGAATITSFLVVREMDKKMIAALSMGMATAAGKIPTDIYEHHIDEETDEPVADIVIDPDGKVYEDDWTGIWVKVTPEHLQRSFYMINRNYQLRGGMASYYEWLRLLGVKKRDIKKLGLEWTEFVGWHASWGDVMGYEVIDCETIKIHEDDKYDYIHFPFAPMSLCIDPPQRVKDITGCETEDIEAANIIDDAEYVTKYIKDTIADDQEE